MDEKLNDPVKVIYVNQESKGQKITNGLICVKTVLGIIIGLIFALIAIIFALLLGRGQTITWTSGFKGNNFREEKKTKIFNKLKEKGSLSYKNFKNEMPSITNIEYYELVKM